jgi:transglutaminase-like putative cysteine protease
MTRGRALEALLAWLASMAALLPLTSLFDPPRFILPVVLVTLTITGVGILLRLVTTSAAGVLLGQLVIGFLALTASQGRGHLWHGLPSPDLFVAWNNRLLEAIDIVTRYAAPAPSPNGIVTALTMIAGVLVLVVDQVAVTRRSPAAAALPLLTAFLISAANNATGVNVLHFLLAALAWLALVGRQGSAQLRRWGPPAGSTDPERDRSTAFYSIGLAANGRRLAVASLALAVVLPMVLPHFPQRYLASGLSRSGSGGGSGGEVSLSDALDVTNNLRSRSKDPVLTYRVDGTASEPLRVAVFDQFDGTRWWSSFRDRFPREADQLIEELPPGIKVVRRTFTADDNRLARPGLALPGRVSELDAGGAARPVTGGVYRAEQRISEYSAQFELLEPTEDQLTADGGLDRGSEFDPFLQVDEASFGYVSRLLDEVAPEGLSHIEQARRIEAYLRSTAFSYSLTLAPQVDEADGATDAVTQFLMTKKGYCLQFATAMIDMARVRGIPARLVTGFLSGTPDDDGTMKVVAADAHAWPELWFPGTGWLRFEPTPGRSLAPDYALSPSTATTGPTTSGGPTGGTSTSTGPRTVDPGVDPGTGTAPTQPLWDRVWTTVVDLGPVGWLVIVLVLGLLGSLALPLLAEVDLRRRRARAANDAQRVELEWQSLVSRLGDLGIRAPTGSTPRQAAEHFRPRIRLDTEQTAALHTVVAQLERARYAAPGSEVTDIGPEAQVVGAGALHEASLRRRLRAQLMPSRARRVLRESLAAGAAAPGGLWRRLRDTARRH